MCKGVTNVLPKNCVFLNDRDCSNRHSVKSSEYFALKFYDKVDGYLPSYYILSKLCDRDHLATARAIIRGTWRSPCRLQLGTKGKFNSARALFYFCPDVPPQALFGNVHQGPGELLLWGSRPKKMTDHANVFKRANQRLLIALPNVSQGWLLQSNIEI